MQIEVLRFVCHRAPNSLHVKWAPLMLMPERSPIREKILVAALKTTLKDREWAKLEKLMAARGDRSLLRIIQNLLKAGIVIEDADQFLIHDALFLGSGCYLRTPLQTAGTLNDGVAVVGRTIPPASDVVNRDLTPRYCGLHMAPETMLGMSAPAATSLHGGSPRTSTWLPEGRRDAIMGRRKESHLETIERRRQYNQQV